MHVTSLGPIVFACVLCAIVGAPVLPGGQTLQAAERVVILEHWTNFR